MKDHITRRFTAYLVVAAAAMLSCIPAASAADVTNLRCEYRVDPLGIDVAKPRLSWIIADLKSEIGNLKSEIPRGQKQTAYQVLVASTPALIAKDKGDLWDSGKVASDQSIQVEYAGPSTSLRTGKPAGKVEGVKFLRMENGAAVYKVGSGRYVFEVTKDVSQ